VDRTARRGLMTRCGPRPTDSCILKSGERHRLGEKALAGHDAEIESSRLVGAGRRRRRNRPRERRRSG